MDEIEIRQAIIRLTDQERLVIYWQYVKEVSPDAINSRQEIVKAQGTVYDRLSTAFRAIEAITGENKKTLQNYFKGEGKKILAEMIGEKGKLKASFTVEKREVETIKPPVEEDTPAAETIELPIEEMALSQQEESEEKKDADVLKGNKTASPEQNDNTQPSKEQSPEIEEPQPELSAVETEEVKEQQAEQTGLETRKWKNFPHTPYHKKGEPKKPDAQAPSRWVMQGMGGLIILLFIVALIFFLLWRNLPNSPTVQNGATASPIAKPGATNSNQPTGVPSTLAKASSTPMVKITDTSTPSTGSLPPSPPPAPPAVAPLWEWDFANREPPKELLTPLLGDPQYAASQLQGDVTFTIGDLSWKNYQVVIEFGTFTQGIAVGMHQQDYNNKILLNHIMQGHYWTSIVNNHPTDIAGSNFDLPNGTKQIVVKVQNNVFQAEGSIDFVDDHFPTGRVEIRIWGGTTIKSITVIPLP